MLPTVLLALAVACSFYFQAHTVSWDTRVRYIIGFLLTINFLVVWAVPILFLGTIYKQCLVAHLLPVFEYVDRMPALRRFAQEYIYESPRNVDFFATQLLFVVQFSGAMALVWYWQLAYGTLPWWLIGVYVSSFVGLGARGMGAIYALSHKEAHNPKLYKPWIRNTVGNLFENWLGIFNGSVPYNFTTTHISLHHRLDSGIGDTLYCWDINRSSWVEYMIYVARAFLHQSGFAGLYQFTTSQRKFDRANAWKLGRGVVAYWVIVPAVILWSTSSLKFYFFIVLEPLTCMGWFLALINLGFHAFIENDEHGCRIKCVESCTLLGGNDDYFGENDHMAHHNAGHVHHRDLLEHQERQQKEWARHKASVFFGVDIFTYSIFVLLKAWPVLATRFVDHSGTMARGDIERLLEARAKRREREHRTILPALPPFKARGYEEGPPEPEDNPSSALYRRAMGRLAALQLWLATQIDKGMQPVPPVVASSRPAKQQQQQQGGGVAASCAIGMALSAEVSCHG